MRALDIAKRLMDYHFHPPTNYFPLIVHEALMIEPTETENKDTLDAFADALIKIAEEARTEPELLHEAPKHHAVRAHGRSQGRAGPGPVLLAVRRLLYEEYALAGLCSIRRLEEGPISRN